VSALVGIDVGTSSTKAVAVDTGGRLLAKSESAYAVAMPHPGWSEQDPDAWWRAAVDVLRRLGHGRLEAVGFSGQMHGLVLVDRELRPLRPAILWNDQRTARECAEIEQIVGAQRLIDVTGNRAQTGFTAPKLLWVRRHEPEVWGRIAHVLLPKDYVRLRVTGELACDVSDASGTLLFDVAARRWSDELLEALELPREWFPPVLESPQAAGRCDSGEPVAAGAGDQAAGAVGVGVVAPGAVSVALGTSGVVFGVLPGYRADPRGAGHTFCHAVPGMWHAMGVTLTAGGALAWLHSCLGGEAPMERLLDLAASVPPGSRGLRFAPYLAGERTPHADPNVRGAFVGLGLEHGLGDMVRAVLEGVAYGLRDSLELLRGLGLDPASGRISGGGGRSRLWPDIVASALDLPLDVPATTDAAALGAAILAGVACGAFADVPSGCERCVRIVDRVEPVAAWREAYAEGYGAFRALYPAIAAL